MARHMVGLKDRFDVAFASDNRWPIDTES